MEITESDKVLATVKQVSHDETYGTTERWDNISELVISCSDKNKEFFPGQEIPAEVERIEGRTAYAFTPRAPYARYVWPGDKIEVKPSYFSDEGRAVAEYSGVECERIHVIGAVPDETVLAHVIKVADNVAIAESVETRHPGLEVGDRLKVTVLGGSSVARTPYGTIDLELTTEAYVSAEVTVEVIDLDGEIGAKIVDPGVLPVPGNELTAAVEVNSKTGETVDGNYEVRLSEPALATGQVRIKIDEVERNEPPKASIVSYDDLFPEVGETVRVWSIEGTAKAEPVEELYQIQLATVVPVRARFDVEITDCEGKVEGELADVGSLPTPGNEVEAEVKRGENRAKPLAGEYPIDLSSPALLTGQVTVAIDSSPDDTVAEGHIVSYGDQLPSVGDRVTTQCVSGQSAVEPIDGTYEIELDSPPVAYGEATIRIDEVTNSGVRGSIVEYESVPDVGETVKAKIESTRQIAKPYRGSYEIHLEDHVRDGRGVVEITALDTEIRGKVLEVTSSDRTTDSRNAGDPNNLNKLLNGSQ